MTSTQQHAELQRQIWQIASEVRGSVDGWDFKQYVLGALFYRFISEDFVRYMKNDDESIDYANYRSRKILCAKIENFIYPKNTNAPIRDC